MIRSFIAVDIPDRAARAIEARQTGLPAGKTLPRENLHLTLAFLGRQDLRSLEELDGELAALDAPAFPVRLSGIELFGGSSGGVVALLAEPEPGLLALSTSVTGAVRRAGIAPERRRFRPHVSLARLARHPDTSQLDRVQLWINRHAGDPEIAFEARSFSLYRSDLSPKGARHTPLMRYQIGGMITGK